MHFILIDFVLFINISVEVGHFSLFGMNNKTPLFKSSKKARFSSEFKPPALMRRDAISNDQPLYLESSNGTVVPEGDFFAWLSSNGFGKDFSNRQWRVVFRNVVSLVHVLLDGYVLDLELEEDGSSDPGEFVGEPSDHSNGEEHSAPPPSPESGVVVLDDVVPSKRAEATADALFSDVDAFRRAKAKCRPPCSALIDPIAVSTMRNAYAYRVKGAKHR